MTGSPIPAGCDAVIPVEQTRELDEGRAVEIIPVQASFQIHSLLTADCWAVLPEEDDHLNAGAEVEVYEA